MTPQGTVRAGTNLEYKIIFENTGNAPAVNIHIQDTLSDNVDISSFKLESASANVYTTLSKDAAGHNVVKFDFPNINLLDSSHHGQCDGMVTFTIDTKAGLANGTVINNIAGIYFDDNDVVMTNTAVNVIGIPSGVASMSNKTKTTVYPNPVNDMLNIDINKGAYSSLNITNTIGQVVITQQVSDSHINVNVQSLPAGIYYVTLKGQGGVEVIKFEKM